MDSRYNRKIMVWHYYLDKQIEKPLHDYYKQILDRQSAAERFAWVNPVVTVQEALNDLSASGYRHQHRFRVATAAYLDTIFNLTTRYMFTNTKLSLDAYKSHPAFDMNKFSKESR